MVLNNKQTRYQTASKESIPEELPPILDYSRGLNSSTKLLTARRGVFRRILDYCRREYELFEQDVKSGNAFIPPRPPC